MLTSTFSGTGDFVISDQYYQPFVFGGGGDCVSAAAGPISPWKTSGDTACVQFHGEGGVGKNGANIDMQYCWVIRLRDGLIAHVTGY
jgi:hypothetical protein